MVGSGNICPITFSANQTINGTLTFSASANPTSRTFARSDVIGTARTLTCNAVAALQDVDFRDITIAGAAVSGGNITGTRLGDCKGNTGITFPASKTVYWNNTLGGNWNANWALSGGGGTSTNNIPLAQDTAVFQSTNLNSGSTVTIGSNYNIGTIDMSARTSNTMTLATGTTTPTIYGNWINGTGTTLTGSGIVTFSGRSSQSITSAGASFAQPIVVNSPSGTVSFADNFSQTTSGAGTLLLTNGSLSAGTSNVSIPNGGFQAASNTNTRSVSIGSGTWSIGGSGNAWLISNSTNFTATGTGTISLTSGSAKTFAGGGVVYSGISLNQGGAGALTISGSNTFGDLTATSVPSTITITSGSTQTFQNFTLSGTSGNLVTVTPSTTSTYNFVKSGGGTVNVSYLSISYCAATPGSTWYMANSTNGGNNSGITFSGSLVAARSFGWIIT